jgi:hypothetical protein
MVSFNNSDEAKNFAVEATSRRQSHEEVLKTIRNFQGFHDRADENEKRFWAKKIAELEDWLASQKFKNGDYPQGIDDLMLELIEWRATVYALQHIESKQSPFIEHVFYQQWLIGSVYATHSLLGKLTGNDPRENSLRNLWWKVNRYIARDGACKKQELKCIDEQLSKVTGQFTNDRSKGILFRNTVIAHNEKSITIDWGEIDADIKVLIRIWSIIVSWSSFGIISPFRTSDQAFSGLEHFFDQNELAQLAQKRQEYLDMSIRWARTFLHSGGHDPGGYFIANISFTSTVVT